MSAHLVDISPGFEFVWRERFDKLRRRRTRNAEEKGIVVRRTSDVGDVDRFVALYRTRLEGWAAGSGYPHRLFRDVVGNGGGRVGTNLAEREGEVLGGHINFDDKDAVTAWCGMASKIGNELHAGTLLYATAMREACAAGFHSYNLGASSARRHWKNTSARWGASRNQYRIGAPPAPGGPAAGGGARTAAVAMTPRRSRFVGNTAVSRDFHGSCHRSHRATA